MNDALVRKRAR